MDDYRPVPLHWDRLDPGDALARVEAFAETMRTRRSVRLFSDEPVPRELVERAIAVAGTAPSGANQQPWTFAIVTDPSVKKQLRDAAESVEFSFYDHRATDEWKEAIRPIGTDWMKPHITDAPVVIVVFEQVWSPGPDDEKVKNYWVKESVGIAVGFLLAALHVAGLAALTHSPAPMGFLREVLGRPENERAFLLIPVGYPAEDATVPDIERKPFDDIVARYD